MMQRGFILPDVLLALAMLALALPVLLGLANRDIELLGHARALVAATLLAEEKLAETEMNDFPPVGELRGDFQASRPEIPPVEERGDLRSMFRWTRTVHATPLEEVREVRISVSWPRGRNEETLEITTYVLLESRTASSSRLHLN